jgi:hypothetical protein
MNTKRLGNNFIRRLRRFFQPPPSTHDAMLVLSLSTFNFTGGWSRTFSKDEYARCYV